MQEKNRRLKKFYIQNNLRTRFFENTKSGVKNMGLFGKLFDKKECAICGSEIGLLGNRKLEDGNMCKACASKLSPWFSERRHSTVADIKAQLTYRAQNQQALESFRPTRRIGQNSYTLIAEERGGIPYRFVVSLDKDYAKENADLILFTDVSSCNIQVDESQREITRTNDKGERESYNPPRYEYSYHFRVILSIENNPYFSEIAFNLNNFSVDIRPDALGRMPNQTFGQLLFGRTDFDPNDHPEYHKYMEMCSEIKALVEAGRAGAAQQCAEMPQKYAAQASIPQDAAVPRFCSNCGAPAGSGKFCENCGSPLQAASAHRRRHPTV